MSKKLILINAKARAGKDTLATYIYKELERIGKTCLISHNADAVKTLAYEYFNWDGNKDDKGRKLLIDITETGYNSDEFFWEKKNGMNDIDRDVYQIPDFRYMTTYTYFKNKGYDIVTVHIERPGFDNGLSDNLKNDISEQGLDLKFDYNIVTDSLEFLETTAKEIVKNLF